MNAKVFKLLVFLFSTILCLSCFVKSQDGKETKSHKQISIAGEYDFSQIDKAIKDKRIVAIGESSHGIGEFYALKSSLVQHMHKDLGYEVLALEASYGDINLAWTNIVDFDALKLRDQTVFGNYQCEEIMPLFDYIIDHSKDVQPLIYAGIDPQTSSHYFSDYLDSILYFVEAPLVDSLKNAYSSFYKIMPSANEPDSTNFIYHRDKFVSCIENISVLLSKNSKQIVNHFGLTDQQFSIIQIAVNQLDDPINFHYKNRYNEEYVLYTIEHRDVIMFENLKYLIEEAYPDKKIIIWGHNGHVNKRSANNLTTKWMGNYLKDTYGEDYYSMGLFAYKGETYQHWTGESIEFENSGPNSIESKLLVEGQKFKFVDFNSETTDWSDQQLQSLELENGGTMSFIPHKRFDGVLGIPKGSTPTFKKN